MNRINEVEISKTKRQILKEFIQLYESFPCLWRIKSKEYHDREMRAKAYKVLAKKLQQIQPEADRPAVVRKINCLRSNLRKEARKTTEYLKTGRVYRTKLWYYPYFNFLNEVSRQPRTVTEREPSKTEESTSDPLGWEYEVDAVETCPVEDYSKDLEESREPTYEVETLRLSGPTPTNRSHIDSSTRSLENDRHDVFGQNVAMKLRHISLTNDTQRIMAEKIINEALYMAEMGLLTTEYCKMLK